MQWTFHSHRASGGQYHLYAYHPTMFVTITPVFMRGNPWWEVRYNGKRIGGPYKFKRAAQEHAQSCLKSIIEASLEAKPQQSQSTPVVSIATMSRELALQTLGLAGNPSEADVQSAHKKLILKVHPDAGGNNFLAQQINIAKDVLLGRR